MCEGIYVGAVCRLLRGTRWVCSCREAGRGTEREGVLMGCLLDEPVFKGSCKYFKFVLSGLTNEGFDHPRTIASKKPLCFSGWGALLLFSFSDTGRQWMTGYWLLDTSLCRWLLFPSLASFSTQFLPADYSDPAA
jgi:hypothetical protein